MAFRLQGNLHLFSSGKGNVLKSTLTAVTLIINAKCPKRLRDLGFAQNRSAGVKAL
jgi:hypothetical protein